MVAREEKYGPDFDLESELRPAFQQAKNMLLQGRQHALGSLNERLFIHKNMRAQDKQQALDRLNERWFIALGIVEERYKQALGMIIGFPQTQTVINALIVLADADHKNRTLIRKTFIKTRSKLTQNANDRARVKKLIPKLPTVTSKRGMVRFLKYSDSS